MKAGAQAKRRIGGSVRYAVVAALAVGWVVGFVVSIGGPPGPPRDPPPDLSYYLDHAVLSAFIAAPWLVAAWLLRRRWPASSGAGPSTVDAPARLLAAAVATLPDGRREWGVAMSAELAQVPDHLGRWRFAAGCARAAVFPPRGSRVPMLSVGALAAAAVIVAGLAVGGALPAMQVFAMAFVGLAGALLVLGVARSRRVRPPAAGPAVTAAGLAGVVACIAVTGYLVVQYPTAAVHLRPGGAVFLAAILAGCLWLTLAPPRGLATSRLARRVAVGAALALGVGLVVVSRLGLSGVAGWDAGIFGYLFCAPIVIVFVGAALVAAVDRSFRAGVEATVWTALLTSLACYAVALLEAVSWYRSDTSLILAGDGIPIDAVGENLRNFTWGLILYPFWWLPFGVIGATVGGARWWRRRGRERQRVSRWRRT